MYHINYKTAHHYMKHIQIMCSSWVNFASLLFYKLMTES